jgi:hypothetical protein
VPGHLHGVGDAGQLVQRDGAATAILRAADHGVRVTGVPDEQVRGRARPGGKQARPSEQRVDQRRPGFYSHAVGGRGSAALAVGSAAVAALLTLLVFEPWTAAGVAAFAAWLPYSAAGFVWTGGRRFLTRATTAWPARAAMGFLAWFYLGLLVQSLAVQPLGWTW